MKNIKEEKSNLFTTALRTHNLGELGEANVSQKVILSGMGP